MKGEETSPDDLRADAAALNAAASAVEIATVSNDTASIAAQTASSAIDAVETLDAKLERLERLCQELLASNASLMMTVSNLSQTQQEALSLTQAQSAEALETATEAHNTSQTAIAMATEIPLPTPMDTAPQDNTEKADFQTEDRASGTDGAKNPEPEQKPAQKRTWLRDHPGKGRRYL